MIELISDRNEFKLIDRIVTLRKQYPNLKVGNIQRPIEISDVYEIEVEY